MGAYCIKGKGMAFLLLSLRITLADLNEITSISSVPIKADDFSSR